MHAIYSSISAALADARHGARVLVAPGRYNESLLLDRPVTVEAFPEGADVEVYIDTQQPYQHTVTITYDGTTPVTAGGGTQQPATAGGGTQQPTTTASAVTLSGLQLRHYSKSVADNCAVYITAGSPVIRECDISSSSGSGVAVEGARAPLLERCTLSRCAGHGCCVFGGLEGGPPTAPELRSCVISGNRLDGLLVRTGGAPELTGCTLTGNGQYGVEVQDAGGSFTGNSVSSNGRGAFLVVPSADSMDSDATGVAGLDAAALLASNVVTGAVTVRG
ncbi:hypothetical protein FOA52_002235 [Chlamydomonas sp. UWO 241]|nr:hypothetical protein FOA52_002235 [Chlamydomonas sp. UWO 241]